MARVTGPLVNRIASSSIRTACRLAARRIDLRVEGLHHLPTTGPVVLAARHYHHFYDGCALVSVVPRPLRILVTLDWLRHGTGRRLLALACRTAGWPVVDRTYAQNPSDGARGRVPDGSRGRLVSATRACVGLLRTGQALLVFPEGYPTIDPGFTPKNGDEEILPFRPGILRIVALAGRAGVPGVPVIPVGLEYRRADRWHLTVRFGEPILTFSGTDTNEQLVALEAQVRRLSGLPPGDALLPGS